MGNSQTKEARGGQNPPQPRHDSSSGSPSLSREIIIPDLPTRSSRQRRGSRTDISTFLGIGGSSEQDAMTLEQRREAKLERETRKAEKEKQTRLRERERSMREEHVDGGYLVTQGVYVGVEDYSKSTVRSLMIERRLAPFWRGLNDFSESWAEHQLMAAARGMPIPPADHVPPELEYSLTKFTQSDTGKDKLMGITIPTGSRSRSHQAEQQSQPLLTNSVPLSTQMQPSNPSPPSGTLFRARARTLASLTSSRSNDQKELVAREFQLPPDFFVNGQPIEVYLYKDASECPICFLYYPPYLNTTRCCEQPICSECFVQIKRPDPHPPEHEQPDPNAAQQMSEEDRLAQAEGLLVSEIATCPYCKQPDFGITYSPPPFRRGLTYGSSSQPFQAMSAMSSQTSISSGQMSPGAGRRRGISLSASAPEVVSTDKVRPDWASKLAAARAHAARRSAAASALHAAAYLMNGQNERQVFPPFGRRNVLRRQTLEGDERAQRVQRELEMFRESGVFLPTLRGSSSRRSRVDDLEEMMLSEAIRLSIAAEDERLRKEEKEAKKKAKKEEKEQKKADKAARKTSTSAFGSSPTTLTADIPSPLLRSRSNTSSTLPEESSAKGKEVDRAETSTEASLTTDDEASRSTVPLSLSQMSAEQGSLSGGIPIPSSEPFKRSHLRQMSTASSASSSYVEAGTSFPGSGTPSGNAGLEPMFNFQSLTAMINEDEKTDASAHVEHTENDSVRQGSIEEIGYQPSPPSNDAAGLENGVTSLSKHGSVAVEPAEDTAGKS